MKFECFEFFDEAGQKVGWLCGVKGHVTIDIFNKRYDSDAVRMQQFHPTIKEVSPVVEIDDA